MSSNGKVVLCACRVQFISAQLNPTYFLLRPLCSLLYSNAATLPVHAFPAPPCSAVFDILTVAFWHPYFWVPAQATVAVFHPPGLLVVDTKPSTCCLGASGLIGPCPSMPMLLLRYACFCLHLSLFLLLQYMQYHGVEYEILPLPTCEPNKSFNLIFQVAERLEAFKLNRYMAVQCGNPLVLTHWRVPNCVQIACLFV